MFQTYVLLCGDLSSGLSVEFYTVTITANTVRLR